jgi:hypothetical protein
LVRNWRPLTDTPLTSAQPATSRITAGGSSVKMAGEYLFRLPDVGPDLVIGAPLPGFPELAVVEVRTGAGLLPAYLRAARRDHGAWCAGGVAPRDAPVSRQP